MINASHASKLRSLGLFSDGAYPWSVFINDLRVITETADNAPVFLHYLTWRARLPLGDRVTVMDELDLWGSYLLAHRFGALADEGREMVGNSTTDFDDYYASLDGRGRKSRKPEKFLPGFVKTFVDRMARERPPGWLTAVLAKGPAACKAAAASGTLEITTCGRLRLIASPPKMTPQNAIAETRKLDTDVTFDIYLAATKARQPQLLWAEQLKPITFELSDYGKAASDAIGDV